MNKITYLFGAGASKFALPLVNEMPARIERLIAFLESDELKLDDNSTYDDLRIRDLRSKRKLQLDLIESLKWMLEKSNKHASIDTFAKKLTIKNDYDSLIKLKIAMSIFFIFEQAINKPDHRYDAFFASIINHIYDFPKNIRILSWNYDYQFEIAFSEYTDQKDILPNQGLLRIIQKYGNNDIHDGFCIYKLNGTTGLYEHDGFNHYTYISNLNGPVDLTFVDKVTRNYAAAKFLQNIRPSLSFAWEPFRSNNDILAAIIENIKDTYSLVIIGYSFPFFNREVDRKIIGNMINLKKVYIQDPYANDIKERFQAIRDDLKGIEFLPRLDTGQFLLPNEL